MCLGCLIYEIFTGAPPFYADRQDLLYHMILNGNVEYQDFFWKSLKDIVSRLLKKNPEERLGSGPGDGEEIRNHPWFSSTDFDIIGSKKYSHPPFIPKLKSEVDVSYFDTVIITCNIIKSFFI